MTDFFSLGYHRRLVRSTLGWRIALLVFAAIAAIEAVVLVPSYLYYGHERRERLAFAARHELVVWLRALGDPDRVTAAEAAPLVTAGPLVGLRLYRTDGSAIGSFGENGGVRTDTTEVTWLPADLGLPYRAVARIDTASVAGDLERYVLRVAGLVLVIAAVVTATTMFVLGHMVLAPLQELREHLQRAAEHPAEADRRLMAVRRRDDLGDVIVSFNHMAVQVAESFRALARRERELDELNRTLEARVVDRTAALNAAIERLGRTNVELRRTEDRFRTIFERSSDAILLIDVAGDRIIDANVEACRMLGFARDELLATPVSVIHADDMAALRTVTRIASREGRARSKSLRCRTRSGQIIPVEASASTIAIAGGEAHLFLLRDITERQRVEQVLKDARDAAEAANRAKTEFLANMSHELRTPLNAIIGFSEIMAHQLFGRLGNDRYVVYAKDVLESGHHLLEIINDILDVAKAEAGKLDLHEEAVDLAAAVAASIRLVRARIDDARLGLTVGLDQPLPRLRADGRKLKQILVNFLSNAAKFTPAGGGVSVHAGSAADGGVEIVVADSGIGISEADLARVMAPFVQVDSALNRRHEGTGLGLPLVRILCELHGGSLTLASTPGRGTRATVAFPADRVLAPAEETARSA